MKKTIIRSAYLMVFILIVSCGDDLTNINKNPKAYQTVPADSFFTNGTRNLTDAVVYGMTFKILAQQFAETTYFDASSYNLVNVGNGFWVSIYRDVLRDLKQAREAITTDASILDETIRTKKLAVVELNEIYAYSLLVNTYGNIPYSNALDTSLKSEALDSDNLTPAYDDAAAIYNDLFARLDKALASIAPLSGDVGFGAADLINSDDLTLWKKFGYSLKLKMAMTLADVNPALSKSMAEKAAKDGDLISDNSENTTLGYLASTPNTNPIWVNLIQSKREDYVASNTLLNLMNSTASVTDPRIALYYTADKSGGYTAGTFGRSNAYANFSHIGTAAASTTTLGVLIDYTEVEFYLAEAVVRGYDVGGTIEEHYNNAITSSIRYWGEGNSAITNKVITDYLADANVAFASAPGTSIQKIARQKYIASFNRGLEAWTEYRRLDYPTFNAPPVPQGDFPIRYTYPNSEQTGNGANYTAAAAAIGGDNVTNKVFWDIH